MLDFKGLYKQHKKDKLSRVITYSFLSVLFFTVIFSHGSFAILPSVPSPTMIFPSDKQVISDELMTVTGLMKKGTSVDVYIDGEYKGKATLQHDKSDTGNFFFHFPVDVQPGTHVVYTVAENISDGRKSIQTPTYRFIVQKPAPTLFAPVVNEKTDATQPYIIGVAKNNSQVQIFIDDKLDGEFTVKNHSSGTTHFAYLPKMKMNDGSHRIVAKRVFDGKVVGESNTISYTVKSSFPTPTILSPKNEQFVSSKPTITGVAKNGSTVQVYIDHRLAGEFLVKDHESGTASFSFTPEKPLAKGTHSIRVRATHSSGIMSTFSKDMIVQVGLQKPITVVSPNTESEHIADDKVKENQKPEEISDDEENESVTEIDFSDEETVASKVDMNAEQQDHSLMILVILTIIVTLFLAWFVWTNREFFKKSSKDEPWKPEGKRDEKDADIKNDTDNGEEPPSLF